MIRFGGNKQMWLCMYLDSLKAQTDGREINVKTTVKCLSKLPEQLQCALAEIVRVCGTLVEGENMFHLPDNPSTGETSVQK